MTTQEEKIRVNARIPKSLYDWISAKYDNVSQAINEGLENLRESKTSEMSYNFKDVIQDSHTTAENVIQSPADVIHDVIQNPGYVIQDDIQLLKANTENYKAQVRTLNDEITRLKTELMKAPDPVDLVRLQERNDGLNLVIEEKNRSIERLEKEVNRLDLFSHYFKSNPVKQIEAPAAEKTKPWWKFW